MRANAARVLLVLGWYDYRLHRGIEKYAQEHGWRLSEDLAREKVIPWGWEGDGILAWLGAGDDLADFVFHAQKPTVDFSFRRPQLKFTRVLEDTTGAAQLVADHFISRGFRNFIFYSDAENWVYNERGNAFLKILKEAGREGGWLSWHKSPAYRVDRKAWQRKREWLAAELKRLPKPVAIFAASDGLALEVLETCEAGGIAVPEEVAIVGAGNSLLAVDAMHTPISSVDTNLEALGYRGAEELDKLMRRKKAPASPIRVPPARLIVRKSSDLVAVNHPGIARSLRYMWDHCHEPIGVDDLAQAAAMSRRAFHEAFVTHIGRSPGAELQHIRIEHAKRLLTESEEKIEAVAEKCGYQSLNSFWVAFRHATRMTPKKYRLQWQRAATDVSSSPS
ncbi:MAG TPA: DNA-binding transcriptional regulator [Candidatus Acidoferrales bacterium]|nr:DNA-binding transcriptional regulator [Candidatus Acidoferrales bacterium]